MVMQKLSVNVEDHHKSKFPSENCKFMSMFLTLDQMVMRLRDIHDRSVIHRDIKPENFMFPGNPDEKSAVNSPTEATDFGDRTLDVSNLSKIVEVEHEDSPS